MSIHYRIAHDWNDYSYPGLECDDFSLPHYQDYHSKIESLYNKLPLKAKKILSGATLHLCSADTLKEVVDQDGVLGLCRPTKEDIFYNIEKFVDEQEGFDEHRFTNLFYHEIGHYLVQHFTQKERDYYTKRFGTTPEVPNEPEADGFSAYMMGLAPYQVQEFWAWWILNKA